MEEFSLQGGANRVVVVVWKNFLFRLVPTGWYNCLFRSWNNFLFTVVVVWNRVGLSFFRIFSFNRVIVWNNFLFRVVWNNFPNLQSMPTAWSCGTIFSSSQQGANRGLVVWNNFLFLSTGCQRPGGVEQFPLHRGLDRAAGAGLLGLGLFRPRWTLQHP